MSEKIRSQHLQRRAILYVRQSSAYQVTHNLESQKLQYAMQERLMQLGWREIEVVDEDLGRSAADHRGSYLRVEPAITSNDCSCSAELALLGPDEIR